MSWHQLGTLSTRRSRFQRSWHANSTLSGSIAALQAGYQALQRAPRDQRCALLLLSCSELDCQSADAAGWPCKQPHALCAAPVIPRRHRLPLVPLTATALPCSSQQQHEQRLAEPGLTSYKVHNQEGAGDFRGVCRCAGGPARSLQPPKSIAAILPWPRLPAATWRPSLSARPLPSHPTPPAQTCLHCSRRRRSWSARTCGTRSASRTTSPRPGA